MPLLADDKSKRLLSQSIGRAVGRHGFRMVAFVFMPEHVHLIVHAHADEAKVHRLLYAIKRPYSFRIKQYLAESHSPLLRKLTIRERPGKQAFRFWQEGRGYNRNLLSLETMATAVDYLHNNPVRRGLCESAEQWKWSSWRYYHLPDKRQDPDLPTIHGFPG